MVVLIQMPTTEIQILYAILIVNPAFLFKLPLSKAEEPPVKCHLSFFYCLPSVMENDADCLL